MKKLFLIVFLVLVFSVPAIAGELVQMPQDVVIATPIISNASMESLTIYFDPDNPKAEFSFSFIGADGRGIKRHTVFIRDVEDDPETLQDETSTEFTDRISPYYNALRTAAAQSGWQFIQDKYTTQPRP